MSGINWGDAPTWAGVTFAAAAAYGALATLASQREQISEQREFIGKQSEVLSLQRQELLDTAEERKREQARQVTMQAFVRTSGTPDQQTNWVVRVANPSDGPLYDVRVLFSGEQHVTARPCQVIDGRWVPYSGSESHGAVETIGSGCFYRFVSEADDSREVLRVKRPVLHFNDQEGHSWQLDEHGRLSEHE